MDKRISIGIVGYTVLFVVFFIEGIVFGNENAQEVLAILVSFVIMIGLLMGYIYLRYVRTGAVIAVKDEKGRYWVGPKEWFDPTTKKEDDLE